MTASEDEHNDKEIKNAFEAFGQRFLAEFAPLPDSKGTSKGKRKRKVDTDVRNEKRKKRKVEEVVSDIEMDDEDDWEGVVDTFADVEDDEDSDQEDVPNYNAVPSSSAPVIVFDSAKQTKSNQRSEKSFMSSNISKIHSSRKPTEINGKQDKDESLAQANDRDLYKLIHTKLLSASLDEYTEDNGAKRKKSLEGRVLELASAAKVGKGEAAVRREEHSKAPKHIRDGIAEKRKQKNKQKIEEAKELGNYHPIIKKLLADPEKPSKRRKRERGLRMGVGSFRGGILTLGKEELSRVQGSQTHRPTARKAGRNRRP